MDTNPSTPLSALTRSVFRQGGGPLPEPRLEAFFGARHGDGVGPGFAVQDRVEGRVVDLGAFRGGLDGGVADGGDEVVDVSANGFVDGVLNGGVGPAFADLVRFEACASSHGSRVSGSCERVGGFGRCYRYNDSSSSRTRSTTLDIADYHPATIPTTAWNRIADFTRTAATDTQNHHGHRFNTRDLMGAIAHHVHWVNDVACLPLDRAVVFHREVIEDYIAHGTPTLGPGSRTTRRSFLLRTAEAVLPPETRVARLHPHHKDAPARPYSEFEQRALRSWAVGQTTAQRRMDCHTILALGLGAGLGSADMMSLHVEQIDADEQGVMIHVTRPGAVRDVPVLAAWEQPLINVLAARGLDDWVLGPSRTGMNKNWLANFLKRTLPERGVAVEVARLRNTWLVHHISTGTPLGPLAAAAGLETFRTIEKVLRYVPQSSHVQARASMRQAVRIEG